MIPVCGDGPVQREDEARQRRHQARPHRPRRRAAFAEAMGDDCCSDNDGLIHVPEMVEVSAREHAQEDEPTDNHDAQQGGV